MFRTPLASTPAVHSRRGVGRWDRGRLDLFSSFVAAITALLVAGTVVVGAGWRADSSGNAYDLKRVALLTDARPLPWDVPGCAGISVVEDITGEKIVWSKHKSITPDRLATDPELTTVLAIASRSVLQVFYRDDIQSTRWRQGSIAESDIVGHGPIEISRDGEFFFVGTRQGQMKSFRLSDLRSSLDRGSIPKLPDPAGVRDGVYPAEILVGPDPSVVYVVGARGKVHELSVPDLYPVAEAIRYTPPPGNDYTTMLRTHGAVSRDRRYIAVNTYNSGQVNLVDVTNGTSKLVRLEGMSQSHGLSFNHAVVNRYFLAVNGSNRVAVFEILDDGELARLAEHTIPPPVPREHWPSPEVDYRIGSVAWSGTGDAVIAATGDRFEFHKLRFDAEAALLQRDLRIDSCEYNPRAQSERYRHPYDVITFNDYQPDVTPTPSASITDTPSATAVTRTPARETATATVHPTLTTAPTATVTSKPVVYLPVALHEQCTKGRQRVDVVLVIDASSSMAEADQSGRAKVDVAREAAEGFLALLTPEQGDQAGLVTFNDAAVVLSPLTGETSRVAQALGEIQLGRFTRLDLGIGTATSMLTGDDRKLGNAPVMIALTDGRSNPVGPRAAIGRAEEAKAEGIIIYSVALGKDFDRQPLMDIATSPRHYYETPTSEELLEIYRRIAIDLPCPARSFWGKR